jgi:hypothetical protein
MDWFLRQLNVPKEFLAHLGQVHLEFQHPYLLTAGLVLAIPLAAFIWLRQKWNLPSAPPGLRFLLTSTRVLIYLLLIGVLGGPILNYEHREEKKPILAVLLDHSQSMQLPAGPYASDDELTRMASAAGYRTTASVPEADTRQALNRISRAKLAHSVLAASGRPLVENWAKKFDVQFWSFARESTRLGVDPEHLELPEPPSPGGSGTWMGEAIGRILDEAGDRPVAGILVFSDGQNNGGRSPSDAARAATTRSIPVCTVPVGSTQRLQDVAITDLFTSGLVSKGDTARVAVTVESQGFDGRQVKVELKEGEKLLDSKDVILRASEQQQIELTFKAEEPGSHYLTVHVPPQAEEPEYLRANNTDTAFVRVSEEKLKVLLMEGLPRWDFRFLKNALRRDNGIGGRVSKQGKGAAGLVNKEEVDVRLEAEWRRLPEAEKARALPRTLDQLAEYHTIIVGDVSPRMLDGAFLDLLSKAVTERGVGLIVAAGPLAMPFRYDSRLQDLLPVRLSKPRAKQGSFRLELSPEGAIHEATRFYDEPGRNQNAWNSLPRYYWYADAERPAPGATVLVWNPVATAYGKTPLVAHHYVGKGRVLFVGTDETFRWRQNVGDRFFYKFWGQAVRFVGRRDAATDKKTRLEVRPVRAQVGEEAQVEVMAFTPEGTPRVEQSLPVRVEGGGTEATVDLTPDPAVKGRYTGKFTPSAAGEYRVTHTPPAGQPIEARLRASVAPEEMRQPNVNRPALQLLAAATNGQMVELPDLESLAGRFRGDPQVMESHPDPVSVWDNWLTLSLLVFLYSLDVGVRRLVGLS